MAASIDTSYFRQEVRQNTATTIEYPFNIDGTATTPDTSVTATVTTPSGGDMPAGAITDSAGTISTNILGYALDANQATIVDQNYRVQWTIVDDSITYYRMSYFDIVKHPLEIPIVKADVLAEQPDLTKWTRTDDTAIQDHILAAHRDIKARISNINLRPYLMVDSSQWVLPHIYLTLSKFARSIYRSEEDKYWVMAEYYEDKYEDSYRENMANLKYDSSDDLLLSTSEKASLQSVPIRRG